MWKSWFIGHELVWMAVPAMFLFLGLFVVAAVRALKKPQSEVSAVAALPLLDDVTSSSVSPSH
jgi:hypothetical protein